MGPRSLLLLGTAACALGQQGPNRADEPRAEAFSYERGVEFLDAAASGWGEQRRCVTCHTNGLALTAWPVVAPESEIGSRERAFAGRYLLDFVEGKQVPRGQRGAVEGLVATTAFMALYDARTGVGTQEDTRAGLDHAWSRLSEDGVWADWLTCNWPPFESDLEFGPALMLVALGELQALGKKKSGLRPEDLEAAERLREGLDARPPRSLHDKAMRLWAGVNWPGWPARRDRERWLDELIEAQADDGGWSMAALSGEHWEHDEGDQATTSEAYPTAFSAYVLLQLGKKPDRRPLREGLAWLRRDQRESGRWFTRSPRRDGHHYVGHAGSVYALLALTDD